MLHHDLCDGERRRRWHAQRAKSGDCGGGQKWGPERYPCRYRGLGYAACVTSPTVGLEGLGGLILLSPKFVGCVLLAASA